jgi:hypothetical protein
VLAHQDRVARLSRRGLDAGGDVDRIADDAELESARATDVAGDDSAGVEPDADAELAVELPRLIESPMAM